VARSSTWSDIRETLRPGPDSAEGFLLPVLVLLTLGSGVVDAASFLNLGHVFVANMTGNVVFLGFALAGAPALSVWSSLAALGAFLVGGLAGGRLAHNRGSDRSRLLRSAFAIQLGLTAAATLIAAVEGDPVDRPARYVLIVLLALALGLQNAVARSLGVPELTTTVLTMTLTGLAADSTLVNGAGARTGRRLVAVAAMLVGALVGAVLALDVETWAPLALSACVLVFAAVLARRV